MTRTEHSMPTFLSKPHFLDCDPRVLAALSGDVYPNRSLHDIMVDVEPNLGTTFSARKRLQANFFLQPLPLDSPIQKTVWFKDLKPAYYPVAWFEEAGEWHFFAFFCGLSAFCVIHAIEF